LVPEQMKHWEQMPLNQSAPLQPPDKEKTDLPDLPIKDP